MNGCLSEETLNAYFDGELTSSVNAFVTKHLADCGTCSRHAAELREAIHLIGDGWNERLPETVPTSRLRSRLDEALAFSETNHEPVGIWMRLARALSLDPQALRVQRLAYAAVALLLLIGSIWVGVKLSSSSNKSQKSSEIANKEDQKDNSRPNPQVSNVDPGTVAPTDNSSEGISRDGFDRRTTPHAKRNQEKPGSQLVAMNACSNFVPPITRPLLVDSEMDSAPFGRDLVRHFEKAQMLLRSFKNTDSSTSEFASELAREKNASRTLLYQNIILRRSAEAKGNLPAGEVLSSLEPILMDIANLADNPTQEDVHDIKGRMQKMEIIGVLQVYSSPWIASN